MYSVTIIGAGKLAANLAHAIENSGNKLCLVINRDQNKARLIAEKYGVEWKSDFSKRITSDFCILAVADDAIPEVLAKCNFGQSIVLHSSGSTSIQIFPENMLYCGVLYPFQTFSASDLTNLLNIPVYIEARNAQILARIESFAKTLSGKVQYLTSEKRAAMHLAAVFACNNVNYMLTVAGRILKDQNLPETVLKHLVEETIRKAFSNGAAESQTGPAFRNDVGIKEKHLQLLTGTGFENLYAFLFDSIRDYYRNK